MTENELKHDQRLPPQKQREFEYDLHHPYKADFLNNSLRISLILTKKHAHLNGKVVKQFDLMSFN